jgi:hypothetical protein
MLPTMSGYDWFSVNLSDINQSGHSHSVDRIIQIPRRDLISPLFSARASNLTRLWPHRLSPRNFFLSLPSTGPLAGIHIINPMTVHEHNDHTTSPGLANRATAMPGPPPPRCSFRTARVQPDGSHRCMRAGTTLVPTVGSVHRLACTRHRALARRYSQLNLQWTHEHPREPLAEHFRAVDGRFQPVSARIAQSGSQSGQIASVTVFTLAALGANTVDYHLTESGTTCPICLDEDTDSHLPHVRLQCGHGMHLGCMSNFARSGAVDLSADTVPCPLCRGDILPDIVQCRHHLLNKTAVKLDESGSHPLRDLVLEGCPDLDGIDQEIRAFCPNPGTVHYVSTRDPDTVYRDWIELGIDGMDDPTEEILEMAVPRTPIRPTEATTPATPPGGPFIDLANSPPPAPRAARRVRRRMDYPNIGMGVDPYPGLYPPAFNIAVNTGQLAHAIDNHVSTVRSVGINLTEIDHRISSGDHSFTASGRSASGSVRYTISVVNVINGQRQLTINIDDVDA